MLCAVSSGIQLADKSQVDAGKNITITFCENEIPPFADRELGQRYGSLYSSLAQYRVYGGAEQASTYVARRGDHVIDLLLFKITGGMLRVLNEGIHIDDQAVEQFASAVFTWYSAVDIISFHAIEPVIRKISYPCQKFYVADDIVLQLPDTIEEYRSRLSKSTRRHLNYYLNRLRKSYPLFRFKVYEAKEIGESVIRTIVSFNRLRMAAKSKVSSIDEAELERIIRLAEECGMVTVMELDGKICAGSIRYRTGSTYFARVNAHDPAYNDYRIGTLCCYLTICECIARGGKKFSFDHGQYENKYRFLGVDTRLHDLTIYRSYVHLVLNSGVALKTTLSGYATEAKFRLLNHAARKNGHPGRCAAVLIHIARSLKIIRAS